LNKKHIYLNITNSGTYNIKIIKICEKNKNPECHHNFKKRLQYKMRLNEIKNYRIREILQIDCLSKYVDKSGFTLGSKDDTDQEHATC